MAEDVLDRANQRSVSTHERNILRVRPVEHRCQTVEDVHNEIYHENLEGDTERIHGVLVKLEPACSAQRRDQPCTQELVASTAAMHRWCAIGRRVVRAPRTRTMLADWRLSTVPDEKVLRQSARDDSRL